MQGLFLLHHNNIIQIQKIGTSLILHKLCYFAYSKRQIEPVHHGTRSTNQVIVIILLSAAEYYQEVLLNHHSYLWTPAPNPRKTHRYLTLTLSNDTGQYGLLTTSSRPK